MKQETIARRWILTLPAKEYKQEYLEQEMSSYNFIGQLEKAESGYEHWQIYIDNRGKGNIRFSTLKRKFAKGHFEKAMGSPAECLMYVSKAETSLGITVKNGEISTDERPVGNAAVMARAHELIVEEGKTSDEVYEELAAGFGNARAINEIEQFAHRKRAKEIGKSGGMERKVSFIAGPPGAGKTSLVYREHAEDLYSVSTYRHPFDNYRSEKVLLLDEFAGQIEFELLLKLLDRFPVMLPARYNDKFALYEQIYVLSNLRLDEIYRDVQRHFPLQWNALMRRIDTYQWMDMDGSLTDLDLPVVDVAAA